MRSFSHEKNRKARIFGPFLLEHLLRTTRTNGRAEHGEYHL